MFKNSPRRRAKVCRSEFQSPGTWQETKHRHPTGTPPAPYRHPTPPHEALSRSSPSVKELSNSAARCSSAPP
ncbi:MAG: hypothetical protein MUC60_07615 [Oscillatoria sp. Prado101]|nr:hypothetical protein [Oscillatoria sp. Prado101]